MNHAARDEEKFPKNEGKSGINSMWRDCFEINIERQFICIVDGLILNMIKERMKKINENEITVQYRLVKRMTSIEHVLCHVDTYYCWAWWAKKYPNANRMMNNTSQLCLLLLFKDWTFATSKRLQQIIKRSDNLNNINKQQRITNKRRRILHSEMIQMVVEVIAIMLSVSAIPCIIQQRLLK